MWFRQNIKTQQQQTKIKTLNTLPDRGIEPGTSCTKADALQLHHRVNFEYRL